MKYELIIFILIVVGNGAVALWKKWKEQQASQPAPRPSPPRVPEPAPRIRERPDRRAEIERLRERAKAKAQAKARAEAQAQAQARAQAQHHARPENRPDVATIAQKPRVASAVAAIAPAATARSQAHPVTLGTVAAWDLRGLDRVSLRQAMLLREVLGPPRSLRPHG